MLRDPLLPLPCSDLGQGVAISTTAFMLIHMLPRFFVQTENMCFWTKWSLSLSTPGLIHGVPIHTDLGTESSLLSTHVMK